MVIKPEYLNIGDLVEAEYLRNIRGDIGILRGIVTSIGEWGGNPTHSVRGYDSDGNIGTLADSTMPIRSGVSGNSQEARTVMRAIYRDTSSERVRTRLERIAVEYMGMSL